MRNCLVTKLKGTVQNDSLYILGSFQMNFLKGNALIKTGNASGNTNVTLKLIGDGHFCADDSYNDDLGKTMTGIIGNSGYSSFYFTSTNGCIISIEGVDYSQTLRLDFETSVTAATLNTDFTNIFKYRPFDILVTNTNGKCSLNIDDIKYPSGVAHLQMNGENVTGDISKFNGVGIFVRGISRKWSFKYKAYGILRYRSKTEWKSNFGRMVCCIWRRQCNR